jgi:adenylosuccinate synthase
MTGKIQIVCGGQFGSEGKGNVAGELAKDRDRLIAVRVAGPNAGHSALDVSGRKWALRCIPVMVVTNENAQLVLAAGSEIDPDVLKDEVEALEDGGFKIRNRLHIDAQATVITEEHKAEEGGYGGDLTQRLGSTAKGIGAARAHRIWRTAPLWGDTDKRNLEFSEHPPTHTSAMMQDALLFGHDIIIEGTQGYGLGLHAGFYPYCTSSDARAIDFLAMTGLGPWDGQLEPWVVLRTFPIRVAGNSGPLVGETTWDDLATLSRGYIQPEKTTVTHKIRRVGRWDPDLARTAVAANGGPDAKVALTFFDYWFPELAGQTEPEVLTHDMRACLAEIENQIGAEVAWLGTGPASFIKL